MRWSYNLERSRVTAVWLFAVALCVFAMVVVGGATRLTGSGLSITEWKPITGALPPLGEAAWLEVFAKYQQTPEYQQINRGMSLADFKFIFFWEYLHRLLGRLIGLAFALPLAWFAWRRAIPPGMPRAVPRSISRDASPGLNFSPARRCPPASNWPSSTTRRGRRWTRR